MSKCIMNNSNKGETKKNDGTQNAKEKIIILVLTYLSRLMVMEALSMCVTMPEDTAGLQSMLTTT